MRERISGATMLYSLLPPPPGAPSDHFPDPVGILGRPGRDRAFKALLHFPFWPATGSGYGTNCCAPVTPSRTCAPSSLISSAKSTLSAVTWVPSNSPTCSNPTASRKTSRLVACACAHPLRPSPHRHPAPASTPLGPNRAASVLWSACANSRQHSAEKCPPALILPTFLPPPQPPITATHFPSNTVIRLTRCLPGCAVGDRTDEPVSEPSRQHLRPSHALGEVGGSPQPVH